MQRKLGSLYETLQKNPGITSLPKNLLALTAAGVLFEIKPSDDTEKDVLARINKELTDEMNLADSSFMIEGMPGIKNEYNSSRKPGNITEDIILKNQLLDKYNNAFAKEKIIKHDTTSAGLSVTLEQNHSGFLTRLPVAELKKLEEENKLPLCSLSIEFHKIKNIRGLIYFKESLSKLQLREFILLDELPDMSGFTRLKIVTLDDCMLNEFPLQLLFLPLKELSIPRSTFSFIPEGISEMASLEKVDLLRSQIKMLPEGFKNAKFKINFLFCSEIACSQELKPFLEEKGLWTQNIRFYDPAHCSEKDVRLIDENNQYQDKTKQEMQQLKETPPLYFFEQSERVMAFLNSETFGPFFQNLNPSVQDQVKPEKAKLLAAEPTQSSTLKPGFGSRI